MDCRVFKTDETFTRMQRPKLFWASPVLHNAPEAGGSSNTHQLNQVTKNMLLLGVQSCAGPFCTVQFRDCW